MGIALAGKSWPCENAVAKGGEGGHQFARASPHASRLGNMHRQVYRLRCASFLQRAPISHPSPLQPASACFACSRVSVCTPVSPLLTFVYYQGARKRLPVTFFPLLHNKHELFPFVHAWLGAKTSAKQLFYEKATIYSLDCESTKFINSYKKTQRQSKKKNKFKCVSVHIGSNSISFF